MKRRRFILGAAAAARRAAPYPGSQRHRICAPNRPDADQHQRPAENCDGSQRPGSGADPAREWSAILAHGISIIGVVCALLITSPDQHWLLWLHACFFGLTWGARGPAITAKTADLFPGDRLGTILGVITIGSGIGSAAGSWAAGWIFDVSGSYRVAFMLSILFYICGCIAFWALRRPPVR